MWFIIAFGVLTLFLLNYVLWFREWLKTRPWPWSQRYFEIIEPLEIFFYGKSETLLWGRWLMLGGTLVPALEAVQLLNIPELIALLPENWVKYAPLVFTLIGVIVEIQRRYTTKPLEVVALPTHGNTPEVVAAVENLEVAKVEAIAAVKIEKAAA